MKNFLESIRQNPGRGGCGIIAIADLKAAPSHEILSQAVEGLVRMEHRGGSMEGTGDGAGILFRPYRDFFEKFITPGRTILGRNEPLIVGTFFFLHGERNTLNLQREVDVILLREGLSPMGWRKVPVNIGTLGARAREDAPNIYQLFVAKGHRRESQLFTLFHKVKVMIEDKLAGLVNVVSLAPYTTVYKALATSLQLTEFYPDLKDVSLKTNACVAHRRYSTNTFSNWNLVQPFRHIAHNGEINTITANCRAVRDAECAISIGKTLMNHGSDSAQFDRVAEMISANGVGSICEAVRRMMAPPWTEQAEGEREKKFFEANRRALGTLGAWEGPIAVVGTDGKVLFAALDRMGLRPLRYIKTLSGRVIISSEIGTVTVDPKDIECDHQLEPGDMVVADLGTGTFLPPKKSTKWIIDKTGLNFENLSTVDLFPLKKSAPLKPLSDSALNVFGWTTERVALVKEMIKLGKEPIVSMGNDRPLAIFSENNSRLYSFLHQIVAVVTNPPIDPIREGGVIDMTVYLGRSPLISRKSVYRSWPQYELAHPILTNESLEALFGSDVPEDLKAERLDATFKNTGKPRDMTRRIHDITEEALNCIKSRSASILVLSDYEAAKGERLPIPMLLVVSSLHRALAEHGLRRDASIVTETGGVHEGHDLATLVAYGATAVNPYALLDIAKNIPSSREDRAVESAVGALIHTLRRIMSKMGITTFAGYRGSALFEAVGISSSVVEYYIPDTVSQLGGLSIKDIYEDIASRHNSFNDKLSRNKNTTVYRKEVVEALQSVAQCGNTNGDYDRFVELLKNTSPVYIRDMLEWRKTAPPIAIDKVQDHRDIIKSAIRGAAMSHGALSGTAHRAIAAAFNHFGSFSNCGEGGEDERRNIGGEWAGDRSRIRQLASGRFGVNADYLVNSDEIEIKIGQGAKPGEGGHLPAKKVTAEIARIRKTAEGIDLISPPPHHDIYSIEDLAQLITNLRELHPGAVISVKVPAITNLGTICIGMVKAGAEIITISCFTGGTGAASSSSILHAGLPLERGIAEAHQYLIINGIRDRVRLRADGGMKSGNDIAKIIALGADEVSIGTPLLIAENCVFCRKCSKGNCPVGVAASSGQGHHDIYDDARMGVIRYLECLALDLRQTLADLGLGNVSELTGRVDLLRQRISGNARWDSLDLTNILRDLRCEIKSSPAGKGRPSRTVSQKNLEILQAAQGAVCGEADNSQIKLSLNNSDHALGAGLAGKIAKGCKLEEGSRVEIITNGYSGHGFGFAATTGMYLRHEGYANDGVAEIISGRARVVIVPPPGRNESSIPCLIGNAAAYGATGGALYVAGRSGQRFGVRNSGATLVCKGVGKYAFEYMTGGIGVVLGGCGLCTGSGMTGGELFIYDHEANACTFLSSDVAAKKISNDAHEGRLIGILRDFYKETKDACAGAILDNWEAEKIKFIHVLPTKNS